MFRKPMRIERWIAFDGAFVEVLDTAQDQDAESGQDHFDDSDTDDGLATSHREADSLADPDEDDADPFDMTVQPLAARSEVSFDIKYDYTGFFPREVEVEVNVGLPGYVSTSGLGVGESFLPFWNSSDVKFSTGRGSYYAPGTDFFFEIGGTEGGSFSLAKFGDISDQHAFITDNNLHLGSQRYIALDTGTEGGFQSVRFYEITESKGTYSLKALSKSSGGWAYASYTDDGGIRFVLLNKSNTYYGNATTQTLLQSLVYTKTAESGTDAVTGYSVSIYYNKNTSSGDMPTLFSDESGGIYNSGNTANGSFVANDSALPPGPEPEPEPPPPTPPTDPIDPAPPYSSRT